MNKLKIVKGDQVAVISGKDKGKSGKVVKVLKKTSKLIVSGVNIALLHKKADQFSDGGIKKQEMPIHISNVAVVDPKTNNPTKVGFKTLDDGKKVRYSKSTNEIISVGVK